MKQLEIPFFNALDRRQEKMQKASKRLPLGMILPRLNKEGDNAKEEKEILAENRRVKGLQS